MIDVIVDTVRSVSLDALNSKIGEGTDLAFYYWDHICGGGWKENTGIAYTWFQSSDCYTLTNLKEALTYAVDVLEDFDEEIEGVSTKVRVKWLMNAMNLLEYYKGMPNTEVPFLLINNGMS